MVIHWEIIEFWGVQEARKHPFLWSLRNIYFSPVFSDISFEAARCIRLSESCTIKAICVLCFEVFDIRSWNQCPVTLCDRCSTVTQKAKIFTPQHVRRNKLYFCFRQNPMHLYSSLCPEYGVSLHQKDGLAEIKLTHSLMPIPSELRLNRC